MPARSVPIAGPTAGQRSHIVPNAPHPILQPVPQAVRVTPPAGLVGQGSTVSLPHYMPSGTPQKTIVK